MKNPDFLHQLVQTLGDMENVSDTYDRYEKYISKPMNNSTNDNDIRNDVLNKDQQMRLQLLKYGDRSK